ncbi:MAG: hypothetical protein MN733_34815, partial [Nitrososphaera sp.]|nr:hypothetical protein [Nitrososphaera sp.]
DDLREQRLPYFLDERPVWRVSAPPAAAPLALTGEWFFDWGGAHRMRTSRPHGCMIGGRRDRTIVRRLR